MRRQCEKGGECREVSDSSHGEQMAVRTMYRPVTPWPASLVCMLFAVGLDDVFDILAFGDEEQGVAVDAVT